MENTILRQDKLGELTFPWGIHGVDFERNAEDGLIMQKPWYWRFALDEAAWMQWQSTDSMQRKVPCLNWIQITNAGEKVGLRVVTMARGASCP